MRLKLVDSLDSARWKSVATRGAGYRHGGLAATQLCVSLFFLPRLAFHFCDESASHSIDKSIKSALNLIQIFEPAHALGAQLEFVERLGATQHHDGQHAELVEPDADCFVENVFVFVDTAACSGANHAGQVSLPQCPERLLDNCVAVVHQRFAVGELVTGQHDRVHRHGVGVGHSELLLDEAAKYARFFGGKRYGKGFGKFGHDSMVRPATCENPFMNDRVTYTLVDGVADVRLNRADKMNALDGRMFAGLIEVGEELRANKAVRAVVLSGNGRAFCAGLDFASFGAMARAASPAGGDASGATPEGDANEASPNTLAAALRKPPADSPVEVAGQHCVHVWQMIPVPVIAAVHGVALGGGIQIALGADIRIVSPDVKMSVLEIRWGLIPDMTGTQMLTRLVGLDVAKELTFTGRMVDGAEAVRIGLATKVSDTPLDDALAMARDIAGKSPHAVRGAKELINMAGFVSLQEGFAAEQRVVRTLIGSPNQAEAVMAFFEKRPPVYADPS